MASTAVRSVIFDLGGVVLDWNSRRILERCYPDPESRAVMRAALFRHPDWRLFDRGAMTEAALLARLHERTGRTPAELSHLLDVVRDSLVPKPAMVALLRALNAGGVPLYCLSNMPGSVYAHIRARYDFWDTFRGIVISAEVGMLKPEPEIFEHLLKRYALQGDETVFIDDHPPNVDGARSVGLQAILFEDEDQCRNELAAWLGV